MAFLEFVAGAAAKDDVSGPTEDNFGLVFAADGIDRSCGWTIYAPPEIRVQNPLILRMCLFDSGLGAGVVRFGYTYYAAQDSGAPILTGAGDILITIPGIANTVIYEDVSIFGWLNINTTLLLLRINRDSTHPLDTYASSASYFSGRTL